VTENSPTACHSIPYCEIILKEIEYPKDFGEAQKFHLNLNKKDIIIWD